MPPCLCGASRNGSLASGLFTRAQGSFTGGASETAQARTVRIPGTFSNYAAAVASTSAGVSRVFQVRKTAANANGVMNLPDGSGNAATYDNTHTDHYSTADTIDWTWTNSSNNMSPLFIKQVYTADAGHSNYSECSAFTGAALGAGVSTGFVPLGGPVNNTESNVQWTMRTAGTVNNLLLSVNAAGSTAFVARLRKNGANGNSNVTASSGLTGTFEDNTNTDTYTFGDLLDYSIVMSSVGGVSIGSYITFNNTYSEVITGGLPVSTGIISQSTMFYSPIGQNALPQASETPSQVQHGFQVSASNFRTRLLANAVLGGIVINVRKNGANANQTLSISSGVTGTFEDTSHVDTFLAADNVTYGFVVSTTGGGGFQHAGIGMTEINDVPIHNNPITRPQLQGWNW